MSALRCEAKKNISSCLLPIQVTSYAMVGDRENILAAGATGYIEKPINPGTFIAEIMEYLPVTDT
jgi:CheY-like chemotaxis protein